MACDFSLVGVNGIDQGVESGGGAVSNRAGGSGLGKGNGVMFVMHPCSLSQTG